MCFEGVFVRGKLFSIVFLFLLLVSLMSGSVSATVNTYGNIICSTDGDPAYYSDKDTNQESLVRLGWYINYYEDQINFNSTWMNEQLITLDSAGSFDNFFKFTDSLNCLTPEIGWYVSNKEPAPKLAMYGGIIYVFKEGTYNFSKTYRSKGGRGASGSGTCYGNSGFSLYSLMDLTSDQNTYSFTSGFNKTNFLNYVQTNHLLNSYDNYKSDYYAFDEVTTSHGGSILLNKGIYLWIGIQRQDFDSPSQYSACYSLTTDNFGADIKTAVEENKLKIYNHLLSDEEFVSEFGISAEEKFCVVSGYEYNSSLPIGSRCCTPDLNGQVFTIGENSELMCINGAWYQDAASSCSGNFEESCMEGTFLETSVALNGSDGCCGDDVVSGFCEATLTCEDIKITDWIDFETSVQQNLQITPSRFREICTRLGCDGAVWENNSTITEGICNGGSINLFDSISIESECVSPNYLEINICEWNLGNDLASTFSTDLGYVSQGGRYFCNKDEKNSALYLLSSANWNWWDAANYEVAYKIHDANGINFISNSQTWFYCNASEKNIPTFATPIQEGETFTLPANMGGYTCVEFLNAVSYGDSSEWSTCTQYDSDDHGNLVCVNISENPYVCDPAGINNDTNALMPISFTTPTLNAFKTYCNSHCYLNSGTQTLDTLNPLDYFCDVFPFIDPECTSEINGSSLNDQLLEKEKCTGPGLTTNDCLNQEQIVVQSCETLNLSIDGETYLGNSCEDKLGFSTYCYMGAYLPTSESNVCCMVEEGLKSQFGNNICGYISDADLNELTCSLMDGVWLDYDDYDEEAYFCSGNDYYAPNVGYCCVGGDWNINWEEYSIETLNKPESFVCYNHGNLNLLSECCNDFTTCYNYYMDATSQPKQQDYYYFGKGGATHSLMNYDQFTSSIPEILIDYVWKVKVKPSSDSLFALATNIRVRHEFEDWSSFDFLEFDVAYSFVDSEMILKIYDVDDTEDSVCQYKILPNLINGNSSMRWHHAVIPLGKLKVECTDLNLNKIKKLDVSTTEDLEYEALFDSFMLSGGDNSPNYYCTGNFGSWIVDLDGPDGSFGFDNLSTFRDVIDVEGYGKYWYACEAQAAFDWTGRKCCGDDTVTQYKRGQPQGGEYYADIKQGCFHGVPIPSGKPVSYSFNDPALNSIMFYNGEFYSCNQDLSSTYKISYDGETQLDALVSESKEEFDVIGDYICFEQNWINKNQVEVSKILLAKMYNLTFNTDGTQYDFEIMCDEPGDIATFKSDSDVNTIINSMCVLRLKVDDEIYTVTGLNFNAEANTDSTKTDAQYFMEKLIPDLNNSKDFGSNEIEALKTACTNNKAGEKISAFSINPTQFFQTCGHTETDYRFAYNPSLNIMFIVDTEELPLDPDTNLYDLMQQNTFGEFVKELWNSFLGLFTGWFGGGDSAGDGILNYAAYMPTFQENFVQFDKVYLAKFGEKHVKALMETREDASSTINPRPNMYFVSVEYQGFGTQVQKLAENYYNDNDYAMDYAYGSDGTQLISLVLKQNDLKKYSYQNDFDWKRLTSSLLVNPEITGNWTTNILTDNCQIDLGEECDDGCYDGNTLYLNNVQTCEDLNPLTTGELSCNDNRTINIDACQELCGSGVCVDPKICFNEACVDCIKSVDCGPDYFCTDNYVCESGCERNPDCIMNTPERPVCKQISTNLPEVSGTGECVECINSADCGDVEKCVDDQCIFYCRTNPDCFSLNTDMDYCSNEENGQCVECNEDDDCNTSTFATNQEGCFNHHCALFCDSNEDCDASEECFESDEGKYCKIKVAPPPGEDITIEEDMSRP